MLFGLACEFLLAARTVRPGVAPLMQPVASVRAAAGSLTHQKVAHLLVAPSLSPTTWDCVAIVAAIADRLGIDQFAVVGGSGGGPHALAVAARLGDRVVRAMSSVSLAPYGG